MLEFKRFDRDDSGYLSRAEMADCGCASLDANGDQILMPAEYLEARHAAPPPPTGPSRVNAPSSPPSGTSGQWRAGQRVLAGCYGNMKPGAIDRVEGDRAWVRFADEPNCDGFREFSTLRPAPENAGRPAPAGSAGSGGAPPSGIYVCQKISGSALIGLGNLEIRGEAYSGIGAGPFAAFTVGAGGDITWANGIRGLPEGWTVTSSRFAGPDYLGRPLIKIGYRTSRGSTDLIDCVRE